MFFDRQSGRPPRLTAVDITGKEPRRRHRAFQVSMIIRLMMRLRLSRLIHLCLPADNRSLCWHSKGARHLFWCIWRREWSRRIGDRARIQGDPRRHFCSPGIGCSCKKFCPVCCDVRRIRLFDRRDRERQSSVAWLSCIRDRRCRPGSVQSDRA